MHTHNKSLKPTAHACHPLCETGRTEQGEFTNEMSNRVHESSQVMNNGKALTIRRRRSLVPPLCSSKHKQLIRIVHE